MKGGQYRLQQRSTDDSEIVSTTAYRRTQYLLKARSLMMHKIRPEWAEMRQNNDRA